MAPDEAFPNEASGGRRDGDVSKPRQKSKYWWGETERVMLPVAIFPKVTVGLTAARAFGALAMRADNKSGLVDSTYEQIAEDAGMSRRQAADGVATLVRTGWVEQVRQGNSRVSNQYRMRAVPKVPDSAETRTVNSADLRTVQPLDSAGFRTVQDASSEEHQADLREHRPDSAETRTVNSADLRTVQPLDSAEIRTPSCLPTTKEQKTSLSADAGSAKQRAKNTYTESFERAWNAYPKRNGTRAGKFAASQQWAKAVKLAPVGRLIAGIEAYAKTCGDLPKDFERWLKNRMWEDLADTPATNGHAVSFDSLLSAGDAKAAANLIRVPYADPSQHPADPTPRAHWLRAQRLEWIEAHEQEIRAALTRRAS